MIEKVSHEQKTSLKIVLTEDEYIDVNLKKICADNGGKIAFVNRNNKRGNANTLSELTELFHKNNLAKIEATKSTLTSFGEKVCNTGGWIKYIEFKKENESKEREEESKIRLLNKEILKLQKQNLTLSNRKLKRDLIIWIIGLFIGAVITNWKDILIILKVLPPE